MKSSSDRKESFLYGIFDGRSSKENGLRPDWVNKGPHFNKDYERGYIKGFNEGHQD